MVAGGRRKHRATEWSEKPARDHVPGGEEYWRRPAGAARLQGRMASSYVKTVMERPDRSSAAECGWEGERGGRVRAAHEE